MPLRGWLDVPLVTGVTRVVRKFDTQRAVLPRRHAASEAKATTSQPGAPAVSAQQLLNSRWW